MPTLRLLDGRAHGCTFYLTDYPTQLWITMINGEPMTLLHADDPGLEERLNRARRHWELYAPVTGLNLDSHGQRAYFPRRRLPDPPDHEPCETSAHATRWIRALRRYLECLQDAPPPTLEANTLLWAELEDILNHITIAPTG